MSLIKKHFLSLQSNLILRSYFIETALYSLFFLLKIFPDRIKNIIRNSLLSIYWKEFCYFLFPISLSIASESQVVLSSLSSSVLNQSQSQFGIVFFSLSNFLLIPLTVILISQLKKGRLHIKFRFIDILLFFFLFFAEISIIYNSASLSSPVWLLKLAYGFYIYFLFSRIKLSENLIKSSYISILLIIFMEGILSLLQFFKTGLIGLPIESLDKFYATQVNIESIKYKDYFRAVGTFAHPNILSIFISMLIPFWSLMIFTESWKRKFIGYLGITLSLITSLITFSRWGVVTNIFGLILTFLLIYKYTPKNGVLTKKVFNKKTIFLISSFIAILIFSTPFFQSRFLYFSFEDETLVARSHLQTQAIATIKNHPMLGIGGGNFLTYFVKYDYTENHFSSVYLAPVHNFYLFITSELGIIGISIVCLILFYTIFLFLNSIRLVKGGYRKIFYISIFTGIIVFYFSGIFSMRSFNDRVGFLYFFLLGLFVNLSYQKTLKLK